MADNNLGTIQVGKVISQRIIEALLIQFFPLNMISNDFSAEPAKLGESVIVKCRGTFTAKNFDKTKGYGGDSQAIAMTEFPVKIDQHVHVTVELDDDTRSSTDLAVIDLHAAPICNAIGENVYTALFNKITVANFPYESVIADNAYDRDSIADIALALNERKVPVAGRVAILKPKYGNSLEKDLNIIANFNQSNSLFNDGRLPRVSGIEQQAYVAVPTNNENLGGVCVHPDALGFATRLPKMPRAEILGGGMVEVCQDANSGLACQVRRWYDWNLGKEFSAHTLYYGLGAGNGERGQRLVTAANG